MLNKDGAEILFKKEIYFRMERQINIKTKNTKQKKA